MRHRSSVALIGVVLLVLSGCSPAKQPQSTRPSAPPSATATEAIPGQWIPANRATSGELDAVYFSSDGTVVVSLSTTRPADTPFPPEANSSPGATRTADFRGRWIEAEPGTVRLEADYNQTVNGKPAVGSITTYRYTRVGDSLVLDWVAGTPPSFYRHGPGFASYTSDSWITGSHGRVRLMLQR